VRVVDPDRAALAQRHRRQALAVAGNQVQARLDAGRKVVVLGRFALEHQHARDVHVGAAAVLEVQERGVEGGQAWRRGHGVDYPPFGDRVTRPSANISTECLGLLLGGYKRSMASFSGNLRDPQVFARVYDEHSGAMLRAAQRILNSRTGAHDVVQDVFLRVWRCPERFDARRGDIGPYLRLMARSRALDVWRERQAASRAGDRLEAQVATNPEPRQGRPELVAERTGERETLIRALGDLPHAQREAVVLAYWGDMTAAEIAERSAVPLGTAKSRVRLGVARLRESAEASLAA
jgi:RNA polymerase sigma-70 factor, ECF subfamily